jgi:paraquat-inducible protein B
MSDHEQQESTRYLKLGVFVLSGIALLVAGIIALGARSLFEHTLKAQTFLNGSVGGLQLGAPVMYRGVAIGKVSNISFAGPRFGMNPSTLGGDPAIHAVVVDMAINGTAEAGMTDKQFNGMIQQMVDRGLRARVTAAGITGGTMVDMEFLDPATFPPPVLPWRPDSLYVPAAPSSGISETLDAVQRIATRLEQADLPGLVTHYSRLADTATSAVNDVDEVVRNNRQNLQQTMADLPATVQKLRESATRVQQILHDPRLERLLAALPTAGEGANAAVDDARRLLAQAGDLLAAEEDDVRGTIVDLRRTAANAAAVTDDAKQNPARLLFGAPPPHLRPGQ